MKKLLLFNTVLFALNASAQTENRIFFSQLMVVFSDMQNNFDYLKGELKSKEGDESFYETNRTLDGTRENIIIVSPDASAYQALIADSVPDEKALLLLNQWKEKLTDALTGIVSGAKAFQSEKDAGTNGYQFMSDKISVFLLRHRSEDGSYWVNLLISPR